MTRKLFTVVATLVAVMAGAVEAQAQDTRVLNFTVNKPPSIEEQRKKDKKAEIVYPSVKAGVRSPVPNLKAPSFKLRQTDVDPPVESTATFAEPFKDSNGEMAMVILMQGNERFMGNESTLDEATGEPREPKPGAYVHAKGFIDVVSKVGPKKSKGALIVYGQDVLTKVPMGPIAALNGEGLGFAKDYHNIGTKQFKNGLEAAFQMLSKEGGRKILVVVGDCGDTNMTVSIGDSIKRLQAAEIEVYAVRATPNRDDADNPNNKKRCKELGAIGMLKEASKLDELNDFATQIAADIQALYTVTFPGEVFPTDNAPHPYIVLAGKGESQEIEVTVDWWPKEGAIEPPPTEDEGGTPWWVWLLVALGVIGLIVVLLFIFAKPKAEPVLAPAMSAPAPSAPPPGPSAPQKTMMLGIGGQEDGVPVVGWIVPLDGPQQFQTFKLSSRSMIGTAPDCQVVVSDPFMSTHHCEVVMTPAGFSLIDKGSTNGSVVNSKRVPTHELVDNDVITLGKTNFKFKSIT